MPLLGSFLALSTRPMVMQTITARRGGGHRPGHAPTIYGGSDRRAATVAPAVPVAAAAIGLLPLHSAWRPGRTATARRWGRGANGGVLRVPRVRAGGEAFYPRFARTGLSDPDPPLLLHLLLDTHPPLVERIETARALR